MTLTYEDAHTSFEYEYEPTDSDYAEYLSKTYLNLKDLHGLESMLQDYDEFKDILSNDDYFKDWITEKQNNIAWKEHDEYVDMKRHGEA